MPESSLDPDKQSRFQRINHLDSQDYLNKAQYVAEQARTHGPEAFLELYTDFGLWKYCSPEFKVLAANQLDHFFGEKIKFLKLDHFTCGEFNNETAIFVHQNTGLLLHLIPGGKVRIGDEKIFFTRPTRTCFVKPLLIGKFPVLNREFENSTGVDSWLPKQELLRSEITEWLKQNAPLRLPSEVEWEYACRGGSPYKYYWGQEPKEEYYWDIVNSQPEMIKDVREHLDKGNSFGLIDLLGNVQEECWDNWFWDYESGPVNELPRIEWGSQQFVLRGGSCWKTFHFCSSAFRESTVPNSRQKGVGFRVAVSLP